MQELFERGRWEVSIRPLKFQKERLEFSELQNLVRKCQVELGGWNFPHIDANKMLTGSDWIGGETNWHIFLESWRLYQSGQFIQLSGFWDDWADRSLFAKPPALWEPRQRVSVTETLRRTLEVFELAARFAAAAVFAQEPQICVSIRAFDLKDRLLCLDAPKPVPLMAVCRTAMKDYQHTDTYDIARVAAEPRSLALDAAVRFFERFNWQPNRTLLAELQGEIAKR